MLTARHLPELERLLVEHAEAVEAYAAAPGFGRRDEDARRRLAVANDALAAFTRRAQAAPPAPVDGEIERLVEDLIGEGCKALAPSEPKVRAARTALLAAIARALSDRDAQVADLERHAAFFRSLVNVRADGSVEQIAALVDADLARRAATWERLADEVAAANVEASARIAALEAGLREAADLLDDTDRPASAIALRAIADATKK